MIPSADRERGRSCSICGDGAGCHDAEVKLAAALELEHDVNAVGHIVASDNANVAAAKSGRFDPCAATDRSRIDAAAEIDILIASVKAGRAVAYLARCGCRAMVRAIVAASEGSDIERRAILKRITAKEVVGIDCCRVASVCRERGVAA